MPNEDWFAASPSANVADFFPVEGSVPESSLFLNSKWLCRFTLIRKRPSRDLFLALAQLTDDGLSQSPTNTFMLTKSERIRSETRCDLWREILVEFHPVPKAKGLVENKVMV